jgi:hypothetical protein
MAPHLAAYTTVSRRHSPEGFVAMHHRSEGSNASGLSNHELGVLALARPVVARGALLLLAAAALYQGVWAQLAPRSFYVDFPGGMSWVAGDGPYNEHLVRDIGGLINGLAVVAIVAAWTLSRPLLMANALGWLIYGLPHLGYHLGHPLDGTSMQELNVFVLTSEIVLPLLGFLGVSGRRELRWTASSHRAHTSAYQRLLRGER